MARQGTTSEPELELGRRLDSALFEPRTLTTGGRGGLARIGLVAWVGGIAAVVAIAMAGRLLPADGTSAGLTAIGSPGPGSTAEVGARQPADAAAPAAISPAAIAPADLVTFRVASGGGTVRVNGTVGMHSIASISVAVESLAGAVASTRTLGVEDPNGGVRPALQRTFDVTFAVSKALATGPAYVAITAFDGIGSPIGTVIEPYGTGFLKVPLKVNQTYLR